MGMIGRIRGATALLATVVALGCGGDDEVDPGRGDADCQGAKCDDVEGEGEEDETPLTLEELTTCVEHDGEAEIRTAVSDILAGIDTGDRADITSVADLVAALPQATRENLLFFSHSRALARVYSAEERRRLMLDTRATDDRTIQSERDDYKWCVEQTGGHEACVEARVLMLSPDGDFIGSFTTNPDSPSAGRFELTLFDPGTSEVTLVDVDFTGSSPKVEENPRSCMACHQGGNGDINFRMDPYRFWAYATPFNEDYVRADSVEAQWYLSYLQRAASGEEPALAALDPRNTLATIEAGIEAGSDRQLTAPDADVDFSSVDSPALNLSHQLLEKNGCRTAKSLAVRPDFDAIKYAAIGGLINCGNVEDFWPTEGALTREDAEAYFVRRGEGLAEGEFDLDTFLDETHGRQVRLLSDKLSRRFDHLADFVGPQRAWEEVEDAITQTAYGSFDGYGVSNFETYGPHVARTRYLLEPLGVDVAQWSMAVDREHHSHVEFFYPIAVQPVFIDTLQREFDLEEITGRSFDVHECKDMTTRGGNSPQSKSSSCRRALDNARDELCPQLAERSREALLDHYVDVSALFAQSPRDVIPEVWEATVDDVASMEEDARMLAESTEVATLRAQADSIYGDRCRGCHATNRGYAKGRPVLPFDDIDELEVVFSRHDNLLAEELGGDLMGRTTVAGKYEFEYISTADRIWDRITRHPLRHGAMPFNRASLARDDKVTLRAHMIASQATND